MDAAQQRTIDTLRTAGYAVVVFYPEEMPAGVNPRRLEDRLVELGVECIQDLKD